MVLKLVRVLDERFEEVVCGACLAAMASCIFLQVIMRYVFSAASAWAEELAVYSMVGAVYLGASLAAREQAHIRIGMITRLFPKTIQTILLVLADLLWLGFLTFLLIQSIRWMDLLFHTTYISPGLGLEQRWPQMVVPLSLVLTMFRVLQVYYRWIFRGQKMLPLENQDGQEEKAQ